ncbi:MAG TPA: hypothetical protein VNO55_18725 [Polyangia bacterium]|nr:hypothetical protein [Polyangia bacterium]
MWGPLAALLAAMEIHAAGGCPSAAEIERRLGPLLGAGTTAGAADVATIKRDADGTLLVSLDDDAGRPIGDRRFPGAGGCADLADTVAVTLAIWEAQIHPEITLRLDRLTGARAAEPVAAAPPVTVTRPPPAAAPPRRRGTIALGASAFADWQPGSWAPGGRVELAFGWTDSRWRGRAAAVGVGTHTIDLAPGQVSWWRTLLVAGVDGDVARGARWAVVLGAGAAVGVASLSGTGFAVNRTTRSLDAGGEVRARAEWRPGAIRPWVGASLVGWLRRQTLELQGAPTSGALSRTEPMVAAGADIVW